MHGGNGDVTSHVCPKEMNPCEDGQGQKRAAQPPARARSSAAGSDPPGSCRVTAAAGR